MWFTIVKYISPQLPKSLQRRRRLWAEGFSLWLYYILWSRRAILTTAKRCQIVKRVGTRLIHLQWLLFPLLCNNNKRNRKIVNSVDAWYQILVNPEKTININRTPAYCDIEQQRTVAKLDTFNEKDYRGLEGKQSLMDGRQLRITAISKLKVKCKSCLYILHSESFATILSHTFHYYYSSADPHSPPIFDR